MTDLHIPDLDSAEQFGHVKPNIERMLAFVASEAPDLLVITGDLTQPDASRPACEWLRDSLPYKVETLFIPGNHDREDVLWDVFGESRCVNKEFCYHRSSPYGKLLFVNSQPDILSQPQMDYLQAEASDGKAVLFIHHPPDLISDGFMARRQPMLNHADVAKVVRNSTITDVFCGHYHNVIDKDCDGFKLHLSPSPAFQISLTSAEFKMEPLKPSVRVIEITEDQVKTWVETV